MLRALPRLKRGKEGSFRRLVGLAFVPLGLFRPRDNPFRYASSAL